MNKIYQKHLSGTKISANPQLSIPVQAVIAGMDRQSRNEKDLYEQTGSRVHARDDKQGRKGFTLIELLINKGHSVNLLHGISRFLSCCFYFINNITKGDPRQKHSGMTALKPLKMTAPYGFTLIELLVVVLIIGILAAVALPQYRFAVEKTRATEAIVAVKALADGYEQYYLANGEYPPDSSDWSVLDIGVPRPKEFSLSVVAPNDYIYAPRINGPFWYAIAKPLNHGPRSSYSAHRRLLCFTQDLDNASTPSARMCRSLCNVKELVRVWGGGQFGCQIN